MLLSEFDYELPAKLIAQEPLAERDKSKLLVLQRETGTIEHRRFYEIGDYLQAGDLLVLNDTQ
ncbi:MAG: S-adenosylmethionine:tRNA ribosyltransferase-isomerase, partial [Armatimonadota bacterium]